MGGGQTVGRCHVDAQNAGAKTIVKQVFARTAAQKWIRRKTMIEVFSPNKDYRCDFCGSNKDVFIFKFQGIKNNRIILCKDCRKILSKTAEEEKISIVYMGREEEDHD